MTIPTKTIAGLVSDMTATWAAQTNTTPIFSSGDVLLAIFQAVSVQLDFLQAQVQLVLNLARAQTSTGADLDSWMQQFNFSRLPATNATGPELFQRSTPTTAPVVIPAGAIVQTVGGGVQYQVVEDTTQTSWSNAADGYVLAVGQSNVTATVQALVSGSTSNVLANQLIQFGSSVPGIDTITNPAPITNGIDAESDTAFRARFILYLATLAKATYAAILAAASSVQQGLLISLLENEEPDGETLLGSFTVIVDDGSGDPPESLLAAVYSAVDATRAFSVQPFVIGPSALPAAIVLSIRLIDSTTAAATGVAVQNAIAAMTNELAPGATLFLSAIITATVAVSNVAAVNAASVTINGVAADLVPTVAQEIRTTNSAIAVSNY